MILTHVYDVDLDDNQMTGTIPPELHSLPVIRAIFFGTFANWSCVGIRLRSTIYTVFTLYFVHYFIFAGGNMLTGPIPPEFGLLTSLIDLYIGKCKTLVTLCSTLENAEFFFLKL